MIRIAVMLLALLGLAASLQLDGQAAFRTWTWSHPAEAAEVPDAPEAGREIQKYATEAQKLPAAGFGFKPVHDNMPMATLAADRFEHQWREGDEEILLWDMEAWAGNDDHKLSLESEGEYSLDAEDFEEAGLEVLYTRTASTFWDLQAGVRHDFEPSPSRSFLALGLQGLAPLWLEVDATAYLSEDGDLSAALEAEYEILLTQRLVLAPRLEAGLSAQDVPEYETWQGLTGITFGCRLKYHLKRKLAPYIGLTWSSALGETANEIEREGEDPDSAGIVAGLSFWF